MSVLNGVDRKGKGRMSLEEEAAQAMPMAQRLREWRKAAGRPHVDDEALLRDMLFVLQGINGKHVQFTEPASRPPSMQDDPPESNIRIVEDIGHVSQSTHDLLSGLAELGWLFRSIDNGIKAREEVQDRGLIEQSLCYALRKEMTSYYLLIAKLESQMGQPQPPRELKVTEELQVLDGDRGLTLRRLVISTDDMRLRLRMAAVFVHACSQASGGSLVSRIHSYTSHGDPFVRSFTDALLDQVSKPFFHSLARWIYEGELQDPFDEFFVELSAEMRDRERRRANSGHLAAVVDRDEGDTSLQTQSLWDHKFGFRTEMLPSFLDEKFGKKIFSTGKSLNFLKYSCGDGDWVTERSKSGSGGKALEYSDVAGLERSIDNAYSIASQRLFEVFFGKFRLMDHLLALKHYLLLGRGDFVEILMEQLGPSLSRPATTLYRHNLTATLETAIRGSTSTADHPDVTRRLDARMLEYSQGELGWDVFTLEYKIDAPLDTILDADAMAQYLRVFNQLWRLKRTDYAVHAAWQRLLTSTSTTRYVPHLNGDFHRARLVLAEMAHFVRQVQSWAYLDVIECQWVKLEDICAKKQGDLDSLIEAHREYLDALVSNVLLLLDKPGKEEVMLKQARDLFALVLRYRDVVDSLCNYALAQASRVENVRDYDRGLRASSEDPDMSINTAEALNGIRDRLDETATAFREGIVTLITHLAPQQKEALRFLGIRCNFAVFYKIASKAKK